MHLEMFRKYAKIISLKTVKLRLDILHENFSEIFVQYDEGAERGLGIMHENFTSKFVQDSVLCRVWIHCYAYFTQYEKGRTLTIE